MGFRITTWNGIRKLPYPIYQCSIVLTARCSEWDSVSTPMRHVKLMRQPLETPECIIDSDKEPIRIPTMARNEKLRGREGNTAWDIGRLHSSDNIV